MRRRHFLFCCCEGRTLLWSQNSSEMCLVHLQGCMESFSFSDISEKKLYLKIYKIKRNMKNLKKKKKRRSRCCEGRSLLWSQNSSEMCLVHLQGCMESFSLSNISEKKLYLKIYKKKKRNIKNLKKKKKKKEEGGDAKHVYFFIQPYMKKVGWRVDGKSKELTIKFQHFCPPWSLWPWIL